MAQKKTKALSRTWQSILKVVGAAGVDMSPKEVSELSSFAYTTIRDAMPKMADAGYLEVTSPGRYVVAGSRPQPDEPESPPDGSIETEDVPTNAAIAFYDLDTDELWATAELVFRVTVHNPKRIGGRRVRGRDLGGYEAT